MSMEVRVRRMEASDVDGVVALASGLPAAPQWLREAYFAALTPGAAPERIALVAETRDLNLAGFTVASVIPPESELESIAVERDFQRMGIARKLFDHLVLELSASGVTEVLLEVRASNIAALSLYQSLGFVETGRRLGYYAHPEEDAIQMRRSIE